MRYYHQWSLRNDGIEAMFSTATRLSAAGNGLHRGSVKTHAERWPLMAILRARRRRKSYSRSMPGFVMEYAISCNAMALAKASQQHAMWHHDADAGHYYPAARS